MPHRKSEEIKRLIDHMQSSLVELFDQFRELRRLLDMSDDTESVTSGESASSGPIFTEVSSKDSHPASSMATPPSSTSSSFDSVTEASSPRPPTPDYVSPPPTTRTDDFSTLVDTTLAAFADKAQSSDVLAEELAAHLEMVKARLISKERPNERVERDMNIVLRFLQKRGMKGIRPEERDNILKRIQRWRAHLTVDVARGE
ncbi:MAG: hypothetical protein K9W43_07920 [Candidatus Thorarchaeota archaeon]|nr:hypothetical protein [Candidatus Thorarchaeota archaeon]